jgi:hypothetical protein
MKLGEYHAISHQPCQEYQVFEKEMEKSGLRVASRELQTAENRAGPIPCQSKPSLTAGNTKRIYNSG